MLHETNCGSRIYFLWTWGFRGHPFERDQWGELGKWQAITGSLVAVPLAAVRGLSRVC